MTSAIKRVRKLHHRGDLISSNQLADARQPQVDASYQAVANEAQRIAEFIGMSPKEALASAVKRHKWEERKNGQDFNVQGVASCQKVRRTEGRGVILRMLTNDNGPSMGP